MLQTELNEQNQTQLGSCATSIDALFRDRFHGAVNIRGIRYQLRYSVLCAIGMLTEDSPVSHVVLEGIEDIDVGLKGFHAGIEYVQVKTSQKPWKWHQLKDPVANFVKVHRANPKARFLLVFDFPLTGDLADLAGLPSLEPKRRKELTDRFLSLCRQAGATDQEAGEMLARIRIETCGDEQLLDELRLRITEVFGLGSEVVDLYVSALTSRFIDWAKERRTVLAQDMARVHIDFQELQSEESEFQAHGKGLLDRLTWEGIPDSSGFFDGKSTQPAHIAADLDVARPHWMQLIDQALQKARVCVVRCSSGQGKTALAYRYVRNHWPSDNTFVLQVAESYEQVQLIVRYLRSRAKFLPTIRLLVDGVSGRTQLWPYVAQEVHNLGGQVLVTIRNEDWFRFSQRSQLSYEIIEPSLDLAEAQGIYRELKRRDKIHESVRSAEQSYEMVGAPHLLMEFVYFITHGQMLEDRLRDQVADFGRLKEDPAKIEILRRVSLANLYGASLDASRLFTNLKSSSDPQQLLSSIDGEYATVTGGQVRGLHQVRSDHLARILHEGEFPGRTDTAISCLRSTGDADVSSLISHAVIDPAVDRPAFMNAVSELAVESGLARVVAYLDGLFAGGERAFLDANMEIFDEGYDCNSGSPFFLSANLAPVIRYDIIGEMRRILGDRSSSFEDLEKLLPKVKLTGRGLDFCREFLRSVGSRISPEQILADLGNLGSLLDWCGLVGVELGCWDESKYAVCADSRLFHLSLAEFCLFAQGLFRYDQRSYRGWIDGNRASIKGYMKLHTDCTGVALERNEIRIRFLVDPENQDKAHSQSVSRLDCFRSVFPDVATYISEGIWLLPFGLTNDFDETAKRIPQENLPLRSDAAKNRIWVDIVESRYAADSYYSFQQAWNSARTGVLDLIAALTKDLRKYLQNQPCDFRRVDDLRDSVGRQLQRLPPPPVQFPEDIRADVNSKINGWASSMQNFIRQVGDSDDHGRSLAVFNFSDARKRLEDLDAGFGMLLNYSPDYFGICDIVQKEQHSYRQLHDILEVWLDPPRIPQRDIARYARARRVDLNTQTNERVTKALEELELAGMSFHLPSGGYVEHPLRYFPLAFSVCDPGRPEMSLLLLMSVLVSIREVADYFCLMPTFENARIGEWGYMVSSGQLEKLAEGEEPSWVTYAAQDLPSQALNLLPQLPLHVPQKLEIRSQLLAILASLDWLQRLAVEVDRISEHENDYEQALRGKWQGRIGTYVAQVGNQVQSLQASTTDHLRLSGESSGWARLEQLLESVAHALSHGTWQQLGPPDPEYVEQITDSIV